MSQREIVVPATFGRAFQVKTGQYLQVIDVEGQQVGDLCAIIPDKSEFLSPAFTRLDLGRLRLKEGDELRTNRRRGILRLIDDPVGTHDILFGPCDSSRYERELGVVGHRNCLDNLREALAVFGIDPHEVPESINLFLNMPIEADGSFHLEVPITRPGDYVTFECLLDAVVALSACPEEFSPCNGYKPSDLIARILDSP
jgi:uncharacterized protein